jgi:hypothetical protein
MAQLMQSEQSPDPAQILKPVYSKCILFQGYKVKFIRVLFQGFLCENKKV